MTTGAAGGVGSGAGAREAAGAAGAAVAREAGGGTPFGGPTAWPSNMSAEGFCGVTNEGVEGDCLRGDAGSWNVRRHRVFGFADCAARCVGCRRCAYITYS